MQNCVPQQKQNVIITNFWRQFEFKTVRITFIEYFVENLPSSDSNNGAEIVLSPQDFVFRDGAFVKSDHFVLECVAHHKYSNPTSTL